MADRLLSLAEVTKRNGTDNAVGLIEEVNTVAPELNALMGRPINGITYKVRKRSALPADSAGTGVAFRNTNEGSAVLSSTYEQGLGQCFFLDGQMQVDEAVISSGMAEGNSEADILTDEAVGVMQQKLIHVGDSFYRGETADAKGFVGLKSLYDTSNCEVDATGTPGSATSAWIVFNDIQGVHWIFGNGNGIEMGEWARQQVTDANGKKYFAKVNNVSGWLGLFFGHTRSLVRIKNLTTASGKGLTDALVAEALAKMPIYMRSQKSRLKLFVNSVASLQLQKSRSTVSTAKTDSGILQFAPEPTESQGVQIVLTDSIPNNE